MFLPPEILLPILAQSKIQYFGTLKNTFLFPHKFLNSTVGTKNSSSRMIAFGFGECDGKCK
jgi:hypothetical protein